MQGLITHSARATPHCFYPCPLYTGEEYARAHPLGPFSPSARFLESRPAMWLIEDGPKLSDPKLVGHKFARQAELAQRGFLVPPLLCVPATVFDHVVGPVLATASGPVADPLRRASELRQRVRDAGVPRLLRSALLDRFDELAGNPGLVAVRACVVAGEGDSGEDSADEPFAGLSDSFLYVGREDVGDRVAACWGSAFNPEAVLYRAHRGLDPFGARVAVGVQRMAMGTRSFVAFTRDPRDSTARCVIAAAHGIGEGVVQEKADIDHFFVDRELGEIEAHLAVKTRAVGWDPERPGQGAVIVPVPEDKASAPVLTDDELTQIAALAARVEQHFGDPQDIEGTITEEDQVYLVQARPVNMSSARTPRPSERPAPPIPWDNNNVTESFPGISCALTFSVARELYEVGFTDLYRRMGVPARTLRRNRPLLRRMIGYLDGRIYYQIGFWYQLHGQIRCFRPLWSTWEQSLGLGGTGDAPRKLPRGKWAARTVAAIYLAEILGRLAMHPWRVRRFLRWWDAYHGQLADVSALRPQEAAEAYRALWTQVSRRWGVTLVNGIFLFTATWAANGLLRRWLPGTDRSLLNGMLCGGPENRSAAAVRSAISLAMTAAASDTLRDMVTADTDPRELWERLCGDDRYAKFTSALREHVRVYGDRSLHDLKMETRTPREEPWLALPWVRAFLRQDLTVEASRDTETEVRAAATRELRQRCRNPLKRAVLAAVFGSLRWLTRIREDTRFCRSELFGDSRALLMLVGEALAAAGCIDRRDDILDLTVDEVLGAFDGTLPGADLRGLAAVRAAERARWAVGDPLPARLETNPELPLTIALSEVRNARRQAAGNGVSPSGVLTGLASSSGIVRGHAKVVLDPRITADQCQGRILIARETDPGWLFLMMSAKALVAERGTLLSHTAITGRMLGIPTVVAVKEATTLIADGSLVEVDGVTGTVRVLDGAP
jgi:rifampicin phosphotransferase